MHKTKMGEKGRKRFGKKSVKSHGRERETEREGDWASGKEKEKEIGRVGERERERDRADDVSVAAPAETAACTYRGPPASPAKAQKGTERDREGMEWHNGSDVERIVATSTDTETMGVQDLSLF